MMEDIVMNDAVKAVKALVDALKDGKINKDEAAEVLRAVADLCSWLADLLDPKP